MSDTQRPDPVIGAALEKELARIEAEAGSHVAVEAGAQGACVEAEAQLPRGWSVVATARYYWDKSWDAAVKAVKRW